MRYWTALLILLITQLGSSCSLSVPCSVSSSSTLSPSSQSSELAITGILSPETTMMTWNVVLPSLVVNPPVLAVYISSCYRLIAASAPENRFLAPAVCLSKNYLIYFSFSYLFKKCVSRYFSAASLFLITSCTMPQGITHDQFQSCSCLYSGHNVILWIALLICRTSQAHVATCSFSEHSPW